MKAAQIITLLEKREREWRDAAERIGVGRATDGWSWEVCLAKAQELAYILELIETDTVSATPDAEPNQINDLPSKPPAL